MRRSSFGRGTWLVLAIWPAAEVVAEPVFPPLAPAADESANAQSSGRRRRGREEPATEHEPVRKQLWNHPVPIFLQVRADLDVGEVRLYYRSQRETEYQQLEIPRSASGGYYVEIPCSMIQPTRWDYYIAVYDRSGGEIATEGTAERPNRVSMVQRLPEPPTRPDGVPITACNPDGTPPGEITDCPPGLVCGGRECRGCGFDDDCLPLEECLAGCCRGSDDAEAETAERYQPVGMFVRLGGGVGGGFVSGTVTEPQWYREPISGNMTYGPDGIPQVYEGGVSMPLAGGIVRLELGYFIIRELSLSLNGRLSFPFGDEFPWLAELRATYWLRFAGGHRLGVFLGGGAGRMAHKMDKVEFVQEAEFPGAVQCLPDVRVRCRRVEPYWWSSGYGSVGFGAEYVFMIVRWFGLAGELAFNPMFPDFSFNVDFDLGLYFAF